MNQTGLSAPWSRQRSSEKKLAECRYIAKKPYTSAFSRGGWPHGYFQCWIDDENADLVDTYRKIVRPVLRNGKLIPFIVYTKRGATLALPHIDATS